MMNKDVYSNLENSVTTLSSFGQNGCIELLQNLSKRFCLDLQARVIIRGLRKCNILDTSYQVHKLKSKSM